MPEAACQGPGSYHQQGHPGGLPCHTHGLPGNVTRLLLWLQVTGRISPLWPTEVGGVPHAGRLCTGLARGAIIAHSPVPGAEQASVRCRVVSVPAAFKVYAPGASSRRLSILCVPSSVALWLNFLQVTVISPKRIEVAFSRLRNLGSQRPD